MHECVVLPLVHLVRRCVRRLLLVALHEAHTYSLSAGIDVGDVIGVCRGWRGRRYRRVRQRGGGRDARDARA